MNLLASLNITTLAEAVTLLGGAIYTIIKIIRELKKFKKAHAEKILEEAKEYDKTIRIRLESRIDLLESDLHNLEASVRKDILHVKEIQANEIKQLADKIEILRQEIAQGHGNLVGLLTKLIDKS